MIVQMIKDCQQNVFDGNFHQDLWVEELRRLHNIPNSLPNELVMQLISITVNCIPKRNSITDEPKMRKLHLDVIKVLYKFVKVSDRFTHYLTQHMRNP